MSASGLISSLRPSNGEPQPHTAADTAASLPSPEASNAASSQRQRSFSTLSASQPSVTASRVVGTPWPCSHEQFLELWKASKEAKERSLDDSTGLRMSGCAFICAVGEQLFRRYTTGSVNLRGLALTVQTSLILYHRFFTLQSLDDHDRFVSERANLPNELFRV